MDMGRSEIMVDRRLRLASSSPDVKALFNSPSYVYNLDNQEDPETNFIGGPPLQGMDYWTPLAPIVCFSIRSFDTNLGFFRVRAFLIARLVMFRTQSNGVRTLSLKPRLRSRSLNNRGRSTTAPSPST